MLLSEKSYGGQILMWSFVLEYVILNVPVLQG